MPNEITELLVIDVRPASNFDYEKEFNQKGIHVYKTTSKNRGVVKIINVHDDANPREGSEVDVANLDCLFQNMGFTVDIHSNTEKPPTKENILQALHDFAKDERLKTADILLLFIMSHGSNEKGRDCFHSIIAEERIFYDEVRKFFTNTNCTYMHDKPKMLFFQTCRGHSQDTGENRIPAQCDGNSASLLIPKSNSDLLIAYATSPDAVAFRWPNVGSLFIRYLCEEFMNHAHERDVATMLDSIYRDMLSMEVLNEYYETILQTGEYLKATFGVCFLNPGIYKDHNGKVCFFSTPTEINKVRQCLSTPPPLDPIPRVSEPSSVTIANLKAACFDGDLQTVQNIVTFLNVQQLNSKTKAGWTALHRAAHKGFPKICEVLLLAGARIDIKDCKGKTALHLAASKGDLQTVQMLLTFGADLGIVDNSGKTPIQLASKFRMVTAYMEGIEY